MKRLSLVAAFALAILPVAAPAQTPAPMMSPAPPPAPPPAPMAPPPGPMGPPGPRMHPTMSPDMMATVEHARAQARTTAYAALSPSHRAQVAAIVAQVNSGKLSDLHVAAEKIDAVLTYNEGKAILIAAHTAMEQVHGPHMRRPMGGPGGPPPPGGPMAGGPMAGPPMHKHGCDMNMGGSPMPMAMGSSPEPMAPPASGAPMPPRRMDGQRSRMHHPPRMWQPPDAGRVMLLLAASPDVMMKIMHGMHDMHDRMPAGHP